MKLTLERQALADACTWVSGAISKNPPQPPLAGILLEASGGMLSVTAFDYDTMRQAVISGDPEAPEGSLLVSGRFLTQIVSSMKGGDVTLETDGAQLTIAAGRSAYRTMTMNVEDYPALPTFPTHVGRIEADALRSLIGTVEHAVSRNPNLNAMGAFNIHGDAGRLRLLATDSFRIAQATAGWADASATAFEVNVPASALGTAIKALEGPVQIGAAEGLLGLSDSSRAIVTRVLGSEDKFPTAGVEKALAMVPLTHADAPVEPMVESLKRAQVVADESGAIMVEFSDGLIRILSELDGSGGAEEVDTPTGFGEDTMVLRFTVNSLLQALLASPSPRVRFGLLGPGQPVQIVPEQSDTAAFVVMPRRV